MSYPPTLFFDVARFLAKVGIGSLDECWEWTAARHPSGYGTFYFNGKWSRAHRTAWELANGPIPEGLLVLHRCDNPPCVNPRHLWLGTDADNTRDMIAKGRGNDPASVNRRKTHCKQGHPFDEENTIPFYGGRRCRMCHNKETREAKRRLREARVG